VECENDWNPNKRKRSQRSYLSAILSYTYDEPFRFRIRIRFWAWASPVSYDKVARLKKSSDKTTKCVNRRGKKRNNMVTEYKSPWMELHLGFFSGSWHLDSLSGGLNHWCVQMAHPHSFSQSLHSPKLRSWQRNFTQTLRLTSGLRWWWRWWWSGSGTEAGLFRWAALKLGSLIIHSSGKCHLNRDARRQ